MKRKGPIQIVTIAVGKQNWVHLLNSFNIQRWTANYGFELILFTWYGQPYVIVFIIIIFNINNNLLIARDRKWNNN